MGNPSYVTVMLRVLVCDFLGIVPRNIEVKENWIRKNEELACFIRRFGLEAYWPLIYYVHMFGQPVRKNLAQTEKETFAKMTHLFSADLNVN